MADSSDGGRNLSVKGSFGEVNRARLITEFFASQSSAAESWRDIYRLLLWVDQTTKLAHCYESDKCQPGKPWYGRSLAFHDWLSRALGVDPEMVEDEIDWLFRRAAKNLAEEVRQNAWRLLDRAKRQRQRYEGRGMPRSFTPAGVSWLPVRLVPMRKCVRLSSAQNSGRAGTR